MSGIESHTSASVTILACGPLLYLRTQIKLFQSAMIAASSAVSLRAMGSVLIASPHGPSSLDRTIRLYFMKQSFGIPLRSTNGNLRDLKDQRTLEFTRHMLAW